MAIFQSTQKAKAENALRNKMNTPTVSVVMPVYNTEKYVREAIESILNQTFTDFELLIINDGSTDNSLSAIRSFTDSRIRVINLEENRGNRVAANIGLREAKGKYVVRMDSDDIAVPDRIEAQVKFMEEHPEIGLSGGHLQLFGNSSDIWHFPIDRNIINNSLIFGPGVSQPVSILRTKVYRENNVYYKEQGESYAEDLEFFLRLKKVTEFGNIDKILIYYRRHEENITIKLKSKSAELHTNAFQQIFKELGIDLTAREIKLHLQLMGQLPPGTSLQNIREVGSWKKLLIRKNSIKRLYNKSSFKKIVNQKWNRLFYVLADRSFKLALAHTVISQQLNINHCIYYCKTLIRKLKTGTNN